jgi:hypothetical protein
VTVHIPVWAFYDATDPNDSGYYPARVISVSGDRQFVKMTWIEDRDSDEDKHWYRIETLLLRERKMIHFVLGQQVSAQWETGPEWHDAKVTVIVLTMTVIVLTMTIIVLTMTVIVLTMARREGAWRPRPSQQQTGAPQ